MGRPALRAIVIALSFLLSASPTLASDDTLVSVAPDVKAVKELLEGNKGRRETWSSAPELVVLTSVLSYAAGDLERGYAATSGELTSTERDRIVADLTDALAILSGGTLSGFATVRFESAAEGETVRVLRKGTIVVGRYQGVRAAANTVGYSGRTSHANGNITAAAIILDCDFDRDHDLRRLLRTHELGHALGFNHVESLVSVMNPRIGPEVSEFDRTAARLAFATP